MRIRKSEFGHNYGSYSFGYAIHASVTPEDTLAEVYGQGFLPYSAKPATENLFYMARSVRLPVNSYVPTSENRRVLRKFEGLFTQKTFTHEELKKDLVLRDLFLRYFKERHGDIVMSPERYAGILARDLPIRAVCYYEKDAAVAWVLEVKTESFIHFWFSCYELTYVNTSLGMYLILDAVHRAQQEKLRHVYLGTAYGEKAKYKMNVPKLEHWDGSAWIPEEAYLREKLEHDSSKEVLFGSDFKVS
jgi:arginyl-tRNA--protein-N-Asp/Glu arginylyltransferase